jgi:hypothetical protein
MDLGQPVPSGLSGMPGLFTFPILFKLGPPGLLTEFLLEENGISIYDS